MSALLQGPAALCREMSHGGYKMGYFVDLTASQDILRKREIFYAAVNRTLTLLASGPVNAE